MDINSGRTLAELLRIQRWAGGESISAATVFGLLRGFETVLATETPAGVSETTQEAAEDVLVDVDHGRQSTDGPSLKSRLRNDNIDETTFGDVMRLCVLQSRFVDTVQKIVDGQGSVFRHVLPVKIPEHDWLGALHYMEIVDESNNTKMHAAYTSCVPRIGEIIEPQRGSRMRVVDVAHLAVNQGEWGTAQPLVLVPHVHVQPVDDDSEHDDASE